MLRAWLMNMIISLAHRSQTRLITRRISLQSNNLRPVKLYTHLIVILIILRLIITVIFSFCRQKQWPAGFGVCCAWFYILGTSILKSVSSYCNQLLIFLTVNFSYKTFFKFFATQVISRKWAKLNISFLFSSNLTQIKEFLWLIELLLFKEFFFGEIYIPKSQKYSLPIKFIIKLNA